MDWRPSLLETLLITALLTLTGVLLWVWVGLNLI